MEIPISNSVAPTEIIRGLADSLSYTAIFCQLFGSTKAADSLARRIRMPGTIVQRGHGGLKSEILRHAQLQCHQMVLAPCRRNGQKTIFLCGPLHSVDGLISSPTGTARATTDEEWRLRRPTAVRPTRIRRIAPHGWLWR